MKVNEFEKKLLIKAKLLFNDGFKEEGHFVSWNYDNMPHSLTNNKKISVTLFGYLKSNEAERDYKTLRVCGNSIKEIFSQINEKIDGLKRGEKLELE